MKHAMPCATAALLILSGAAFAQEKPGNTSPRPGQNTNAVSAVEDATAGVVGRISAEMTTTTKGFVEAMAISDMYEVTAGKLAAERSKNPAVRDFAQQMVTAHTETTAKLKSLIAANKINAAPPASLDSRRQGMLNNLKGAAAADFDTRYITQQVAAHKEADALLMGFAKDGDQQAIRQFARETDKHVKMHLTAAEKLATANERGNLK